VDLLVHLSGLIGSPDPQRRLPILSTYLGHAHVTDTYWYLTGIPELLGAAGKRLEKRWEGMNGRS
jgi:integrase/recombinase XerD